MKVKRYRKRPVVIEAIRFTDASKDQALNFIRCNSYASFDWKGNPILKIQTIEGEMTAKIGDWIIKGVAGEFYPCDHNIFLSTYDEVTNEG